MTTALLIIDIQNDYFPGGTMTLVGADAAAANAARLLKAFRERGLPVFHVQHLSTRPGATFFLPDTRGAEIHEAVKPAAGESVTVKHFPNCFRETRLLEALRAKQVDKLVVAGMMTHMCVDTTVRAAADLGFACQLAGDGCATRDLVFNGEKVEAKNVQLAYLAGLNGLFAAVLPTEKLCAA
jgi:nicotinamidase-related amidase